MYIWDRLDEKISRVEQVLITILLTMMILLAFSQIVLRNFFVTGISWGDSLVRYLVVWVGFIGAAIATKEEKHINIDVVSRWLTEPKSNYIRLVSHFFSAVICGLLTLAAIIIEMHRMPTTPVLVAIPLFTFAGYLLPESGAPKRLIRLSNALLGRLPGGLSVIALVTCAVFTALTGATGLTIIALGGILLPAMMRGRYSENFSLGLLTTSGTLGLLFSPSLPLIIYAIVAKVRIDHLFIAGILPGILLIVLLSVFSVYRSIRTDVPQTKSKFNVVGLAIREALWELPLPVVVLGGIYSGYFAVSEAAAITAVYVLLTEMESIRFISASSFLPTWKSVGPFHHWASTYLSRACVFISPCCSFTSHHCPLSQFCCLCWPSSPICRGRVWR